MLTDSYLAVYLELPLPGRLGGEVGISGELKHLRKRHYVDVPTSENATTTQNNVRWLIRRRVAIVPGSSASDVSH